jgi:hypothetical protein
MFKGPYWHISSGAGREDNIDIKIGESAMFTWSAAKPGDDTETGSVLKDVSVRRSTCPIDCGVRKRPRYCLPFTNFKTKNSTQGDRFSYPGGLGQPPGWDGHRAGATR